MVVMIGLGVLLAVTLGLLAWVSLKLTALRGRFSTIVDADMEVKRLRGNADREIAQKKRELDEGAAKVASENETARRLAHDEAARVREEARRDIEQRRQELAALVSMASAEDEQRRRQAETEAASLRAQANADLESAKLEAARIVGASQQEALAAHEEAQRELERTRLMVADAVTIRERLGKLTDELRAVEGNLEDISFGLYKPHYNFDTPERFKAELDKIKDRQKELVRSGEAARFAAAWTVGGSSKDGERMQRQYCKLMLRAFNGESDAAIAKINWNNATKMEERINKAFEAINELGGVMTVSISSRYRDLKLAELRLEYELEAKKRDVAEEQRRIREQMRDEEKAQREAEKALADAEAETTRFQKALDKAKVELSKVRGEEHERMSSKILSLQKQLAEAHAKSVRAKTIAELTKAGYVYVISNIGSFGDHVFKIGMTRRLEPMDRVKELGDASVPFPFDVHAMVYSEDAPALENLFHRHFKERSVNLLNMRKEFFAVGLDEIEAFANARKLEIVFTKVAEAREYRESMQLREASGPTRARVRRETYPEQVALA